MSALEKMLVPMKKNKNNNVAGKDEPNIDNDKLIYEIANIDNDKLIYEIDNDKLIYEIFSILESKLFFNYNDHHHKLTVIPNKPQREGPYPHRSLIAGIDAGGVFAAMLFSKGGGKPSSFSTDDTLRFLADNGHQHKKLPESYVRPEADRPGLTEVVIDHNIPVIDLSLADKSQIVSQIAHACQSYGLFQVVNHGMSDGLMEQMMAVASEFFSLPAEEKMSHYSDDPSKKMRLSTSFNIRKEKIHNWRDYLRLHCYPLEEFVPDWPSNPSSFKDVVSTYCREVRELGFRLLGLISLSLGLEHDYIEKVLGEQEQHMAINYYPPCPEPELTYGLPAHTDPNALTILLQDQHVAGLQVLREGRWIAVAARPRPDALVINIGDQLQALSNSRYKSVWHRAVVNSSRERMSVASFLCPCNSAVISPAKKLTGDGSRAMYRSYTYNEYYNKFWSRNLDQEHCLELFNS